ncbi:M24 family metallopeptidase [Gallaecimonas kandeliae]|uniref:M24B family metallopeptidase n=1 Tax=Gallaecimonas kandeliae TaxID=3029055 RepID=UPI00264987EA|nr:M24B family metallopeptidase [Gallaecimonas kandeliae]WKE66284.1 M24 family metallopeptidase [Gallaecimonas kandeliae]
MISAIQAKLGELHGWLLPHDDDYLNEYLPAANERLAHVTGFTGSAGIALVTQEALHIWVDGRYRVQVRSQVPAGTQIHHLVEEPIGDYFSALPQGARIGFDSFCVSARQLAAWQEAAPQVEFVHQANLVDALWEGRPALPHSPGFALPVAITGRSCQDKRQALGQAFAARADWALLAQPDSLGWLTNLRGGDVPRLPVLLMRGLLHKDGRLKLFVDQARLPAEAELGDGVEVLAPDTLHYELAALKGQKVLVDEALTPAALALALKDAGAVIVKGLEPTLVPKACKNAEELAGMREAHLRDGAAVSQFLCWLDAIVAKGQRPDESTLADKLESFRLAQADYLEPSFDTISAAGANAALPHYNFRNGAPAPLPQDGLYLVDSGGQYPLGTTDVTRTLAIGQVTAEQKRLFTLVLKGHIALGSARFVKGTCGHQLDLLARAPLWAQGYDYDHGTGHGVGQCLSVHEGPQRIGKAANNHPLLPGMVLSNEPGYYREGAFGIRVENLVVVSERQAEGDRPVYGFDNLTFIPMDRRLLDLSLLSEEEKGWWNRYHGEVLEKIGPRLEGESLAWLETACAPL